MNEVQQIQDIKPRQQKRVEYNFSPEQIIDEEMENESLQTENFDQIGSQH